jgi:cation diffusion facilitator CzcD-associated flavoprotein CzcO
VIVHPQTWPADLDYKGKRVIVIGSGATAATIVPAMAAECAHITMLQRSPTYFTPGANAQRTGRHAARARDRRDLDPRDRPPQGAERPGQIARLAFEKPEELKAELIGVVRQPGR